MKNEFELQKIHSTNFSSEATCLEKAVWLEHQILLATKSEPMYKMKYMSKVTEILINDRNQSFFFSLV